MAEELTIYTDGGARGNPGPAGIGVAVYGEDGKLAEKHSEYVGERTNNEAEYLAVIKALELARQRGVGAVKIFMDSELVVRQLSAIYKIKQAHLQQLVIKVRKLEADIGKVKYYHIRREKNRLADQLVNEAIDRHLKG